MNPGFAAPVRDSQAVFRRVMDAMARPGTLHRVDGPAEPPAGLARATAAVLLTLVDAETPLWLGGADEAAAAWVAFHCGAMPAEIERAAFGVSLAPVALERLSLERFWAGSDEAPERSATVVLQVAALGTGQTLRLRGPGLAGEATLAVDGLPAGFEAFWQRNGRRFPRGIDLILCAGDALAALPRTVGIG